MNFIFNKNEVEFESPYPYEIKIKCEMFVKFYYGDSSLVKFHNSEIRVRISLSLITKILLYNIIIYCLYGDSILVNYSSEWRIIEFEPPYP